MSGGTTTASDRIVKKPMNKTKLSEISLIKEEHMDSTAKENFACLPPAINQTDPSKQYLEV